MKSLGKMCLLLIMGLVLYSCTKVVNINLNDSSPQIVIQGNITDDAGPYQVQIIKTVNFSDENSYPAVSGATVSITDATASLTEVLTETSPGIYKTNTLHGTSGHTYQLSVLTEGKTYVSSSTMPQPVPFDSITFLHSARFGGNTDINAVANFQDPAGGSNYYSFAKWVRNEKGDRTQPFSDRLSDGRYVRQQLFADSIGIGDVVKVEMNCLDKGAYDYYNTLGQVTGGNNFNSVSPSNPVSNISGGALGYFSAHTVQSRTAIAY